MAPETDAFVGCILNARFEIRGYIASGGFADVYAAFDNERGSDVAVKMLNPFRAATDLTAVVEFETEARLFALLTRSANVVDYDGTFTDSVKVEFPPDSGNLAELQVRYHALERADGSLDELLATRDQVDWTTRLLIFRDIVCGAHQMHRSRIVHRDTKSSNALLFGTSTRRPVAKLTDLGRSRDVDEPATAPLAAYVMGRGDMSFAPPELLWLLGKDDGVSFRRVDAYLLGSVFFELACGQGITGLAIPDAVGVVTRVAALPASERDRAFRAELANLRAAYAFPHLLLKQELPSAIRDEGVALVRQLCDPDPSRREVRRRVEMKLPSWGLEWLIRRVDILHRRLTASVSGGRARQRGAS